MPNLMKDAGDTVITAKRRYPQLRCGRCQTPLENNECPYGHPQYFCDSCHLPISSPISPCGNCGEGNDRE